MPRVSAIFTAVAAAAALVAPTAATLPLCAANVCAGWIDGYGGNITELQHGEVFALEFSPDDVTNLWQVTACGDVFGYSETYGKFELLVLDDHNLELALNGQPFSNCSCGDIQGDDLSENVVTSACVSVSDDLDEDVEANNALECGYMHEGQPSQTTCANVAVRCASPGHPNSTHAACRLGLSVQILKADPFMAWWSFEYIPIVFGVCLVVMFVAVMMRRVRRQRQRNALMRLLAQRGGTGTDGLLGNEVGGGNYRTTGTVVAEGTVVDDTTLPTGTYVAGRPPAPETKPVAEYYEGSTGTETIFQADLEAPPGHAGKAAAGPPVAVAVVHSDDTSGGGGGGGGGAAAQ